MFVIKLMDKTSFEVSDEVAGKLTRALSNNIQWVMIKGNQYNTSTIMIVEKSKLKPNLTQPLLAPPTIELTDEQRQSSIDRIQRMKRDFFARSKKQPE